ncbi:FAD/NAD(P)-binding protein [Microbacterium indicum]|uniref:FAD/NAD(P)-binding protein n=1 Tax=Microbacterium indicum TaxID=358100 RepID=UPI00040A679F|nr:FAD/NAD(P)-binding protein [Microbacterium indicum]
MSAPQDPRPTIAIIGGGPRGVSILERIGARLAGSDAVLDVRIVDDTQVGAGRIWRTDQSRQLYMNTLADAVTLFPDASVTMTGPVVAGPTLHEWCMLALGGPAAAGVPAAHRAVFERTPVRPGFVDEYRDELEGQRPESHPSRALYGEYISWCFDRAAAALPAGVSLAMHTARVTRIDREGGRERLALSDGSVVSADAVVAATGWLPRTETPEEEDLTRAVAADPDLVWVRPDSPVDQDLDRIPAGGHAIVRGLGMGFFDAMALVTAGRGGRFVADAAAPGGLRYEPSGREPILHVTSHRGVPFRAKALYGSLPPKAPLRHLRAVDWAAEPRPIDVDARMWPLILQDAYADWCDALARVSPGSIDLDAAQSAIDACDVEVRGALRDRTREIARRLADAIRPHLTGAEPIDLIAEAYPGADERWDSPAAFDAWVAAFVAADLAEAERGSRSLVKAALWSISASRAFVSRVGSFGGLNAESRRSAFRELMSVGGMVGSGPPAFRNRQLLALHAAGLVRFLGPAAIVAVGDDGFRAEAPAVARSGITARALVDAWMHSHDVRASADPLVASLEAAGRIRPFRAPAASGAPQTTEAFDVDPATGRAIRADGTPDPALHISGIPIDAAMHDAVISPMPGSDPTMLRETDRVAASLLRTALEATA